MAPKTDVIEQLRTRIAELEAENARLKAECDDIKQVQFPRKLEAVAVGWKKQLAAAQEQIANETAEACAKYVNRFLNGDGIQDEAWIRDIESGIRRGTWKEFK